MLFKLLFRFLFFVALLLVIRALLRSLFSNTSSKKPSHREPPPTEHSLSKHMEKDPVCGMYISAQDAHTTSRGGVMFYFCSEECRKKFQAMPTA